MTRTGGIGEGPSPQGAYKTEIGGKLSNHMVTPQEGPQLSKKVPGQKIFDTARSVDFSVKIADAGWKKSHQNIASEIKKTSKWMTG